MTEADIVLLMVRCAAILLAVWIFLHLLCQEYLRALEFRGLIRRIIPEVPSRGSARGEPLKDREAPVPLVRTGKHPE